MPATNSTSKLIRIIAKRSRILFIYYNEEDVIERLHYTNTQPMWDWQNLEKGNRYIGPCDPDK